MSKKLSKRFTFVLSGVNTGKIDQKYGLTTSTLEDDNIPNNATNIDDLDIIRKTPDIISFLDESKRPIKCFVSMIDFQSGKELCKGEIYKCFWDKNHFPGFEPIGCPIKYIPSKATKSYHSEISKEKYTIVENVTEKRANKLVKDPRISIETRNQYQTDGIFCSFNCCIAYLRSPENKLNPLYRYSESLLLRMYQDINPEEKQIDIAPAPHWRLLKEFGGHLTIEQFRESFNRVNFVDHGIFCVSIGRLYEDQLKF